MSVFVDIAPDEPQVGSAAVVASAGKWRGRITRAALPLLSVVVFFIVWQLAAASGTWNETFVPYPSTVWRAFLDVSTTHDGTRGYQGYLLLGAPLHDAAPGARRRRPRRAVRRHRRPADGHDRVGPPGARAVAHVPACPPAAGLLLPAGDLAGHRRGTQDHAAGAGGVPACSGRDDRGRGRGSGQPHRGRTGTGGEPVPRSSAT